MYRRFSPSILSSLGEPGTPGFSNRVKDIVEDKEGRWDTEVSKAGANIPTGMALVMCDVDCGSNTPSMVKKVLAWRASDPTGSKTLFEELQKCNEHLGKLLTATPTPSLLVFEKAFAEIRTRIRVMGDKSGVPIEPREQTELLDAVTVAVEGVAGGVVPGAGGYDAIVLLVRDDEKTMEQIRRFLEGWGRVVEGNFRLLGTKGELEGARVEKVVEGGVYGVWLG